MFDEIKNLIRDALKVVRQRIEPIEADVTEIKAHLADLKAFRDELKSAGFGDLKADVEALGGKAPVEKAEDSAEVSIPDAHVIEAGAGEVQAAIPTTIG